MRNAIWRGCARGHLSVWKDLAQSGNEDGHCHHLQNANICTKGDDEIWPRPSETIVQRMLMHSADNANPYPLPL